MAAKNITEEEQLRIDLGVAWFEGKHKGDTLYEALFKMVNLSRGEFSGFLQLTMHVPLTTVYIIFASIMLAVFIRGKMLGFVQQVLILCAFINLVPMLVASPFVVIFYYIADINAPTPYPSCMVTLISMEYLTKTAHMTSLHLKLLLGVNRLCTVYRPFKTASWFSKSRCKVYCLSVVLATVGVSCIVNFVTLPITKSPCIGDIWGNGKTRLYYACSLYELSLGDQPDFPPHVVSTIVESTIMLVMPVILLIQNVLFLVQLKRSAKMRNEMTEGNTYNSINDKKLNTLNRISLWVMVTCFLTEIPNGVVSGLILYRNMSLLSGGLNRLDRFETLEQMFKWIVGVVFRVIIPIDLLIFTFCSKKAKDILKNMFMSICLKREN